MCMDQQDTLKESTGAASHSSPADHQETESVSNLAGLSSEPNEDVGEDNNHDPWDACDDDSIDPSLA